MSYWTDYRKANWSHHEINQKYESLKKLMLLHNKAQWSIIITALNMMIRNTMLKKMVQRHAPSVEPSNLIKGLAGLKGMEPNKKLDLLSQQLHPLGSDIIQLCVEGNDKKIRHQLKSSPEGQKIINEFDLFMQKFGHLSANTTNFTETPWIENPKMIWKSIGTGASQQKKIPDDNPEMIRSEKREEVLKNLNMLQKPVFLRLLNSTITYLGLREKISLLLSDGTHQFRRLLLSIGDDLVKKGMLAQADDTFFLFSDDLENIIKDNGNIGGFTEMVTKRREQIARDAKIVPEDTICGDQIYTRPQIDSRTSEFLSGICGSSGYKQGYAYVAESPDNVQKSLTADDILVVPYTHVGWTPLFSTIGGIIAETGGQLSHTAIIAREYGIPAIVNVQNVMQLIKTGERLSIDADAGRIYLKHENSLEGEG